ncbi:MAG: 2-oxoacid:ferredoxin oxidoreductase subunit beta [Myxococcales bacterium]|nr:2-oxoacid:ferredoxin oxidoreductase subunit beta [Myxococcales bacterium]
MSNPTSMEGAAPIKLTRKDYASDQDVRWCPGCGDYAILAQVQKVFADLRLDRDKTVFVSGIGCSSRFPYYMNTYGVHSIHGRAPAIASGLKVARPELAIWVVTGDGDGLSIGGNHLIHAIRRNIDLKILLFNNRIYGLTKGQYSPTSEFGKRTVSTPHGVPDRPFNPVAVALGAGATFVARAFDTDTDHLQAMLRRAHAHKGTAFIEIYQNCNVFNDGAFEHLAEKKVHDERVIALEHGKPLLFGPGKSKGLRFDAHGRATAVEVGEGPGQVPVGAIACHDESVDSSGYAFVLSQLDYPTNPVPIGIFRAVERPTYEQTVEEQARKVAPTGARKDIETLWHQGDTWVAGSGGDAE